MYVEYECLLTPFFLLNFSLDVKEKEFFHFSKFLQFQKKTPPVPNQIKTRNQKLKKQTKKRTSDKATSQITIA